MGSLGYVKALEGASNKDRCQLIINALSEMGLEAELQQNGILRLSNVICDLDNNQQSRLLFSAHYDTARGSPGANDNASGVAVLLSLANELRHSKLPIRLVFFDREESRSGDSRLKVGLLGSFHYVLNTNLQSLTMMYNIEHCGEGDTLIFWPIDKKMITCEALLLAEKVAKHLNYKTAPLDLPWAFMTSDHFPFRIRGVRNSLTISVLPHSAIDVAIRTIEKTSIFSFLLGHYPELPPPFSRFHTKNDTSCYIKRDALYKMQKMTQGLALEFFGLKSPYGDINK
jgi:hypothetical protein